ncbi:MAG: hypothetical protein JWO45_182 [Spartobacteria bacterium]|nr:hypothetical protein [Spartobacteria bacterium]
MKRVIGFWLAASLCLSLAYAASNDPLTVADYFLKLPDKYFEDPPARMLDFIKQPACGVIDIRNGYISCIGDGAQPPFEVALFRYRDGHALVAVCSGELEGPESVYLDFFVAGSDGKMKKTSRSIFPIGDAGSDKGDWRFELPRHGRTVIVRRQGSKKIQRQFAWNGEKFAEEK